MTNLIASGWQYILGIVGIVVAVLAAWLSGRSKGQQMPKLRLMLSQLTRPLSNHKPPVISKPQSLRLPKMQTKRISLFLITLLVTACGNQSTTPTIKYINVDSACTAAPIITHGADPDVMDAVTVKAINAHNDKWDSLCENEGEI